MKDFGETAKNLARNPPGVVALFLVLVYVIAFLLLKFSDGALSESQRWPLVWFLVSFPPLVLGAFIWLVAKHPSKLYAPSDFKTEEGFFRSLSISPRSKQEPTAAEIQEMQTIREKVFGAEEVDLDGRRFVLCSFKGSTLVFRATRPVHFEDIVRRRLDGSAALTVDFLTGLYNSSEHGRKLVEGTLDQIRGRRRVETG